MRVCVLRILPHALHQPLQQNHSQMKWKNIDQAITLWIRAAEERLRDDDSNTKPISIW